MIEADLNRLAELEQRASCAPWYLSEVSDHVGLATVAVTKNPSTGREVGDLPEWTPEDVVAACLLHSNMEVGVEDRRWNNNARLIATARNTLPELLERDDTGVNR